MSKRLRFLILFITGILIGILAKFNCLTFLDRFVYNMLMSIKCTNVTNVFKIITTLGNTRFIIFSNIIIVIFYAFIKKNSLLLIPFSSILSPIINNILKFIFRRPRPDEIYRLITESNYSFPSGHAMISILFYGSIIVLINRSNIKHKIVLNTLIILIILLIGITRVYLGVHYVSDVIGGYLISLSIIVLIKGDEIESVNNRSK